jgi:hypothetical protein
MRLRWLNTRGSLKHNHSVAPGGTASSRPMVRHATKRQYVVVSPGRTGANFFIERSGNAALVQVPSYLITSIVAGWLHAFDSRCADEWAL